jgi:alcohol-forming fatty acyl-CoA reductase
MLRVQQKISTGLDVLQFFTMRNWMFASDKFQALAKQTTPDEYKMFFMDTESIPDSFEDQFVKNTLLGGRQYVMKEPLSTLPKARIQMKM